MKYRDREGRDVGVETGQDQFLKHLYGNAFGRAVIRIMIRPWVSRLGGYVLDSFISKIGIRPFVKKNNIDLSMCEKTKFRSYNDFFTRKLREEARIPQGDEKTLISPCDGKLSVYPISDIAGRENTFRIKDTLYTTSSLLRSGKLAKQYEGGMALVFRLTVDDYHRYCYVADGEKSQNYHIRGVFHTVNPVANDVYPIYKENTREYSLLKTKQFKTILMMEVGALMVGRITNYEEAGTVRKGQEKGKFEFGGSTIILLLQKDAAVLDSDLIRNTEEGYETIVKMGERIGTAK